MWKKERLQELKTEILQTNPLEDHNYLNAWRIYQEAVAWLSRHRQELVNMLDPERDKNDKDLLQEEDLREKIYWQEKNVILFKQAYEKYQKKTYKGVPYFKIFGEMS